MLTQKEALYYDEQLHPAFAGYLHDGAITERDVLAAVFHLLTKGILDPVWEDGSMLKNIVGARKTKKTSILPFNQLLVEKILGSKNFLPRTINFRFTKCRLFSIPSFRPCRVL